ncbi:hypothetical protein Tco_0327203 [Tanacetum coccineum]
MFPAPASHSFFEGAQATPSYDQHMSFRYPSSHLATVDPRRQCGSSHNHDVGGVILERRVVCPSMYFQSPYMNFPDTSVTPKKQPDKSKNMARNAKVPAFDIGNAVVDAIYYYKVDDVDNAGEDKRREVTQDDYTFDQMVEWTEQEHFENEETKEVQLQKPTWKNRISLVIKKRVEDLQLGVESYQKKLNITGFHKTFPEIEFKELYTPSYKPPGVIYKDLNKQKRVMRADELYKFSDGTLKKVLDELHHRVLDFRLGYNDKMLRRKWTARDKKRSKLMVELIDKEMRERLIIRNLERLVGARELEMDYKLMTRTV